jgi:methylated-DNA-[protein]-cysteine S-methyltransferase
MRNRSRGSSPTALPGHGFCLFPTSLGLCGIAWTPRGIDRVMLPHESGAATRAALAAAAPGRAEAIRPPAPIRAISARIARHLKGRRDPLADVPLDLDGVSDFARRVYARLRQVPPGELITYSGLARASGRPGAARSIGRIMGANPVPVLIPCHRVVTATRKLGGYSAPGGPRVKARILYAEGVHLDARHPAGIAHLRRRDPALRAIIDRVGPCLLGLIRAGDPYEALVQSILYQQLSGKAAATIERRVRELTSRGELPRPQELAGITDVQLRSAGVSRQKASYLRDLAVRVADGRLPLARLGRMTDEEVIARLTEVKGIGLWSAQMFLMFQLARLDVLPTGDLGLRNAVGKTYGLGKPPTPAEVERIGAGWAPYRSMGTWYLWRNLEAGGI